MAINCCDNRGLFKNKDASVRRQQSLRPLGSEASDGVIRTIMHLSTHHTPYSEAPEALEATKTALSPATEVGHSR